MLNRVKELSEIERKVLLVLSDELISFENCSKLSLLPIDSVRRASAWLSEKDFAIMKESTEEKFVLTDLGNKALLEGLPESIFLSALSKLGGRASFSDLQKASKLSSQEFTAALGINKRKAFIVIVNGVIEETGVANDQPNSCENILQNVVDGKEIEDGLLLDLQKRGLVEKKLVTSRLIKISKNGGVAQKILSTSDIERTFDVSAPVPEIFAGKKTPYVQFLQQIRHKLVALGFEEVSAPLVVTEFYNFDVLFQPQNHPARTWTDSYQLLKPRVGSLPNKKIVSAIKSAHENGGVSKSKGWGYEWSESIASRAVPAMHGTAHSARQLVKGVKSPHKYFAIARCFRPDVLDATHLIEFNQMEGFVVGDDLNFKHLLGMLKDFAIEFAGAEKVKFFPDYYPFTEPSVQLSAKHPEMGWIEFAGAGMFRPEMLENLGIKGQAIAWGVGIDRLAMFKLGIKDIRYLFSEDIGYLRKASGVFLK
ncbi:MAG: phenylalanine--tRNA ligase subunit alpha [Candidatus Diapherotrites archaeon]|jgi:phenylalanyl-tRNA synthetase alpha chain|uniref:phenylalanine--tRNA ligase n=1 Tax=Candidatus Iainarchaeum sp. TaxID=3101447 RepID=A0A7K4C037_9ARCH|nr:phenylalanine--tRNA ligase subunit alpha [Candidatus Diapherotrites archaeon]